MKLKRHIATLITTTLLSGFSQADDTAELYFSDTNPELTAHEEAALAVSKEWQEGEKTVPPTAGKEGAVTFVFGSHQPSIVCAVLQVCDITLQAGEQVNSINIADIVRWRIEPAISGEGEQEITHLIVKPLDTGLETSLVVTTNRRSYHLKLRSHRSEYMPIVSFSYPEEAMQKWNYLKQKAQRERQERTIPETGEYLGQLNFNYSIEGKAGWKPVRVYNDGTKTIIQMPTEMSQTEAPALLVVRRDGGLFKEPEHVMVNYRIQGDRYIVDSLFEKAILVTGVGKHQDRIIISKEK